jgi:hydrogenase-1 operon protein HyaF
MPSDMHTYSMPSIPEPEEVAELVAAKQVLGELQTLLAAYRVEDPARVVDITGVDTANRELIDQVLALGEVSIIYNGDVRCRVQESVLAGVWRVEYVGEDDAVYRDTVEIAAIPSLIATASFPGAAASVTLAHDALPPGVQNAPPLLVEINDHLAAWRPGAEPHIINLTLLPHTPEDLAFLDEVLGGGPVTILSRGYGNCRITATATTNVWRVKYFNARDAMILNTIEVVDVPAVALASQDDIDDSAERLDEILQVYR